MRLTDARRFDVPVTTVCPEYRVADLRAWVEGGDLPELAAVKDLEYVDLPAGHWPRYPPGRPRPGDPGQRPVRQLRSRRITIRGIFEATASVVPTCSKPAVANIDRVPTKAIVVSIRPGGSTG